MTHAYLCSTGFEEPLAREIGPGSEVLAKGVVITRGRPLPLFASDFVFARQVLPEAVEVHAPSIRKLAAGAVEAAIPVIETGEEPWRLDFVLPDDPVDWNLPGEMARRSRLLREAFQAILLDRRRKTAKRRVEGDWVTRDDSRLALVQVLLFHREKLLTSVCRPGRLPGGAVWPSRFPAGRFKAGDDWDAPSSAFRKLREALAWFGREIRRGERCIDLGAAPGGWSHVALQAGARVVAVDRANLDPRLAANPRLVHERRTGFSYAPEDPPVDWLLCDIIAEAARSLSLLRRWAEARWFRRTVFHLKFKGTADYHLAAEAVGILKACGYAGARAKHLYHDRNEVTVWAE